MDPKKFVFQTWSIWIFVISGTIIRLFYGIYSKAWMAAPDQIAWGLSLDEMLQSGFFSYKQLIHYPHEGGSLLVSLIALALHPFNFILPSLSLAALFIDTASRFLQIKLAQKIFGNSTAFWFMLWTVLAVPLLLPWSTVNFGLHALASFLPFAFVYYTTKHSSKLPDGIWCGLITGLSIAFSYDSIIFIPAYFVWKILNKGIMLQKALTIVRFAGICLLVLIPHFLLRLFADNGFHLESLGAASIRGVDWNQLNVNESMSKVWSVFKNHLPASFFLSTGTLILPAIQKYIVIVFAVSATIFSLFRKNHSGKSVLFSFFLIFLYCCLFAFSPFYSEFRFTNSYIFFRHFVYIIPIMVVFIIYGLSQSGNMKILLPVTWILICSYFSIVYLRSTVPVKVASYHAAGWVLARKYGEQPEKLKRLSKVAPESKRDELMKGFGWGLAAILLEGESNKESKKVRQLNELYSKFDSPDQLFVRQGFEFAFSPDITPVLDHELRSEVIK